MAVRTWTLTDIERNLATGELSVTPSDVGGAAKGYSVRKYPLTGGLRGGQDTIEVDNGSFKFLVLPTRGMGLWKAWLGELELGWRSPVKGPVHPMFVNLADPSGLGWLDGFDELLCRCGLESNGAPEFDADTGVLKYPLHGKIANRPAHQVELAIDGESGEITVTGTVDESRFHFQKLRLKSTIKTKVGEPGLRIIDEVTNLSGNPAELELLYHINFGQPLLDPGSQVVAPIKTLVPRNAHAAEGIDKWQSYGNEQAGAEEQVYFLDLIAGSDGMTGVLLKNAHSTQGVSLNFPKKQLPTFTVWKNTPLGSDGYVTGLEPGINFPNPRSFEKEQGRVMTLKAGEKVQFEVALRAHGDAAGVAQAEAAVAKLQGTAKPKIFDAPQAGWCKM